MQMHVAFHEPSSQPYGLERLLRAVVGRRLLRKLVPRYCFRKAAAAGDLLSTWAAIGDPFLDLGRDGEHGFELVLVAGGEHAHQLGVGGVRHHAAKHVLARRRVCFKTVDPRAGLVKSLPNRLIVGYNRI